MNFLLSLNKKLYLTFISIFICTISIIFLFIYLMTNNITKEEISINQKKSDILKPKFSINSKEQKISVTAAEGNFLTEDEIMLENNVVFKSNNFKIYAENVIFNKKTLVASSKDKSKFVATNTSIDSNGFDIIQNGNIINFKGKTKLTLK